MTALLKMYAVKTNRQTCRISFAIFFLIYVNISESVKVPIPLRKYYKNLTNLNQQQKFVNIQTTEVFPRV